MVLDDWSDSYLASSFCFGNYSIFSDTDLVEKSLKRIFQSLCIDLSITDISLNIYYRFVEVQYFFLQPSGL